MKFGKQQLSYSNHSLSSARKLYPIQVICQFQLSLRIHIRVITLDYGRKRTIKVIGKKHPQVTESGIHSFHEELTQMQWKNFRGCEQYQ